MQKRNQDQSRHFFMKHNPRWTVLYRRKHKNGRGTCIVCDSHVISMATVKTQICTKSQCSHGEHGEHGLGYFFSPLALEWIEHGGLHQYDCNFLIVKQSVTCRIIIPMNDCVNIVFFSLWSPSFKLTDKCPYLILNIFRGPVWQICEETIWSIH